MTLLHSQPRTSGARRRGLGLLATGGAVAVLSVAGCSSSDGTAVPVAAVSATTPGAAAPATATSPASTTTSAPAPTTTAAGAASGTASTPTAAPAGTPGRTGCGPDLTAPAIADAARSLGTEPLTGRPFATDPVGGNYDPCATLSTALVVVEGGTGSSPVQALMFHDGQYLGTGTSTAYGNTSFDARSSTDDTVVLDYKLPGSCNACNDGTYSSVRYRWDGSAVQMLDPAPPTP